MLQERTNNGQNGQAVTVIETKGTDSTHKEAKSLTEKEAKVIRKFLSNVGLYEADALRIAIRFAEDQAAADKLSKDEQLALDRYLNVGLPREGVSSQTIQAHRVQRASALSKSSAIFCDKMQILNVYESLMAYAIDTAHIEQARQGLSRLSSGGVSQQSSSYTGTVK